MEKISSQELRSDVNVTQLVVRGMGAPDRILDVAKEQEVDIIVMGTHGRSGFKHFLPSRQAFSRGGLFRYFEH